ncbi:MAG TPA: helicase SNF2 [Verrucomicrobia bacterium]|nr:MAG: helicase SNF2 [Lentisphaerae bacterium GWF2_57_35]HBA85731.1 helicase SNF2 [Verrucomicrobiota bacterium]
MSTLEFSPGALVRARGREWVVQPGSRLDILRLRPLGGSDSDIATLNPALEIEPPGPATFDWPNSAYPGNHDAARLLRDALLLKLRAGAGPFRSFGNIAVEPRAYQLVPLLMAMRQSPVRLLIADDVGIGKTIEAGLILRELLDRGEVDQAAILTPPHLVEQWQKELQTHFNINAVCLTSSSVARLERDMPRGTTLFEHYRFVIVSLDYIKSERHRDHFLSIAPNCILVDEAHSCVAKGQGRQLRFELLQHLAQGEARHIVLLTATPHSGDATAFHNLLSLLNPEFVHLEEAVDAERDRLRTLLADQFVQRRRKDIEEWHDSGLFPKRMTSEITYILSGRWGTFFDRVQAYCVDLAHRVESADPESKSARIIWYATLALLRCAASSPAAAQRALNTRLNGSEEELTALAEEARLYDGDADDLQTSDLEPPAALELTETLRSLIVEAGALVGIEGDPKLKRLVEHIKELLSDGFRPVVFCRYIATAHYVAEHLKKHFPQASVEAVTGEYTPEEREARVTTLGHEKAPILVATDCLSEGVNLQEFFTAVVHYDLAWNPTRHEQREGRVDRFGQSAKQVRCTMLYGQDNPIDGFILQVVLRKAQFIKEDLGVLVPMPENQQRINLALVKAAMLRRKQRDSDQLLLELDDQVDLEALATEWQDAHEKAKINTTRFAQRRLKPEEVLPEWNRQTIALGAAADVSRFVAIACQRLGSPLERLSDLQNTYRFVPSHLPSIIRERLQQNQLDSERRIGFEYKECPPGVDFIHRSHPLVSILADSMLENAVQGDRSLAARCAATVTRDVEKLTALYLLRLRYQITVSRRGGKRHLLAEETVTLSVQGRANPEWSSGEELPLLLDVKPIANLSKEMASKEVDAALGFLKNNQKRLEQLAAERSERLLNDHRRIREAARDVGSYDVEPCLPVDVIGVYVLLPDKL